MPRSFTGSSSAVVAAPGAIGARTFGGCVLICRNTGADDFTALFAVEAGANNPVFSLFLTTVADSKIQYYSSGIGNSTSPSITLPPSGDWFLIAAIKGTGSVAPRFHRYAYSTDTWIHENGGSNVGNSLSTPATSSVAVGALGANGGGGFRGDIAAAAYFANRTLTDDEVERLPFSLAAWTSLTPTAMWVLDQSSTSQKVTDWSGGGANESTLLGTSVSTASVPILGYGHPVTLSTRTSPPTATGTIAAALPALSAAASGHPGDAQHLFTTETPSSGDNDDGAPGITTATTVRFAEDGNVYAIRFYATTTVSGTYTAALWTVDSDDFPGTGTLLDSQVMAGSPVPGAWNLIPFDIPIPVTSGVLYRAGVHSSAGRYVASSGFFDTALVHGDITAPQAGTDPIGLGTLRQGTFEIDASLTYPDGSAGTTNYFTDVDYAADDAPAGETGTVAVGLPALSASVFGTVTASGTAAAALPALSATATGTVRATGTAAVMLPALTAAASGTVGATGTTALTLPSLTAAASGTASAATTTAITLPALTAQASATATATGTAAATLPALTAAVTGAVGNTATTAITLPPLSVQASGTASASATVTPGLPAIVAAVAGTVRATGTTALTLPSLAASATGTAGNTASAAITLPALSIAASGTASAAAAVTTGLPALQAAIAGDVQGAVSGGAAVTLPPLTASANGTASATASMAATLPPLAADASGTVTATGTAALGLPPLQASATGQVTATGSIDATMPALQASAAGATGVGAIVEVGLPALVAAAQGTASVSGTVHVSLPALVCAITDAPAYTRRPGILTAGTIRPRLVAGTLRGPQPSAPTPPATAFSTEGSVVVADLDAAGLTTDGNVVVADTALTGSSLDGDVLVVTV